MLLENYLYFRTAKREFSMTLSILASHSASWSAHTRPGEAYMAVRLYDANHHHTQNKHICDSTHASLPV